MTTVNTSNPYNLDELFMTLSITDIKQAIKVIKREQATSMFKLLKNQNLLIQC